MSAANKVAKGDSLAKFKALEHNRHVDATDLILSTSGHGAKPERIIRNPKGWTPNTFIGIRNDTGLTLPRFSVVQLGGVIIDPTEDDAKLRQAQNSKTPFYLKATIPTTFLPRQRCVITQRYLPEDRFDPGAVVLGDTWARVNITDATHDYATCTSSSTDLVSAKRGFARILYKPTGAGVKDCVVNLTDQIPRQILGKADGVITAASGDTPGTGTAKLWHKDPDTNDITEWLNSAGTQFEETVLNATGVEMADLDFGWCEDDIFGDMWIQPAIDAATGLFYKFFNTGTVNGGIATGTCTAGITNDTHQWIAGTGIRLKQVNGSPDSTTISACAPSKIPLLRPANVNQSYWPMQEETGQRENYSGFNTIPLQEQGTVAARSASHGYAADFVADQNIYLYTDGAQPLPVDEDWTIFFLVNADEYATGDATWGRGIARYTTGENPGDWTAGVNSSGKFVFNHWKIAGDDTDGKHVSTTAIVVSDETSLGVGYQASDRTYKMWINGASDTIASTDRTGISWGVSGCTRPGMEIGRIFPTEPFTWNGTVNEFYIERKYLFTNDQAISYFCSGLNPIVHLRDLIRRSKSDTNICYPILIERKNRDGDDIAVVNYPLNEPATTLRKNTIANEFHLEEGFEVVETEDGLFGKAAKFHGDSQNYLISQTPVLPAVLRFSKEISVNAWIRDDSASTNTDENQGRVFVKGGNWTAGVDGEGRVIWTAAGGVNRSFATDVGCVLFGEWAHVTITKEEDTWEVEISVDGVLKSVSPYGLWSGFSDAFLQVGGNNTDPTAWEGLIANVSVLRRRLSTHEVGEIHCSPIIRFPALTSLITTTGEWFKFFEFLQRGEGIVGGGFGQTLIATKPNDQMTIIADDGIEIDFPILGKAWSITNIAPKFRTVSADNSGQAVATHPKDNLRLRGGTGIEVIHKGGNTIEIVNILPAEPGGGGGGGGGHIDLDEFLVINQDGTQSSLFKPTDQNIFQMQSGGFDNGLEWRIQTLPGGGVQLELNSTIDLKAAIVPLPENLVDDKTKPNVQLLCTESPEVWFQDRIIAKVLTKEWAKDRSGLYECYIPIDPKFLAVTEPDTLTAQSTPTEYPLLLASRVIRENVVIRTTDRPSQLVEIVIMLTGVRRDCAGVRFDPKTNEEMQKNSQFWKTPRD